MSTESCYIGRCGMTREEAIKYFEKQATGIEYTLEHSKACRMAVEALRAQQAPVKPDRSWWEGCEVCRCKRCSTCKYIVYSSTHEPCRSCNGHTNNGHTNYVPLKYCQNCGKPLTEEAWEETARRMGGES